MSTDAVFYLDYCVRTVLRDVVENIFEKFNSTVGRRTEKRKGGKNKADDNGYEEGTRKISSVDILCRKCE